MRTFYGRPHQALLIAEDGLRRHQVADNGDALPGRDLLLMARCLAHAYAGDLMLGEQLATAYYGDALNRHADELQGQWALAVGQLVVLRGRVATARRWLQEASALIEEHAPTMGRYGVAYALCFAAEAAALSGDLPAVDTAAAQADALGPDGHLVVQPGSATRLGRQPRAARCPPPARSR